MRKSLLPALVGVIAVSIAAVGFLIDTSTIPPRGRFGALLQPEPRLRPNGSVPFPPARVAPGPEDPVSALTRHGEVDGWRIDLIYSNPLLPRSQQNGEVIFKVLMTRIVPEAPLPDLAGGATLTSSQGLIAEGFTWELEEALGDRVLGYLSCAVTSGPVGFLNADTRWIRVSLASQKEARVIFEWNLDRLRQE